MRFHFDFIGRKYIWFTISGTIIVIGLIAILAHGLNFGIEFKGGTLLDIKFSGSVPSIGGVRKAVTPYKIADSVIQEKEGSEILIRTRRLTTEENDKIQGALKKAFKVKEISTTTVGPGWGSQVTDGAIKALIFSLLALITYISIRFEYKMALASVAAVFHDILVVVGVYAIIGLGYNTLTGIGLTFLPREVTPNTVAALLTILGYSLYDNIVVFHRIQENTPLIGKRTYSAMANDSINQVLMRSINTSLTALIPVTVLLLFGGETLKDFAFVLLVGMISGAYSTIFIGSPVFTMLKEMEPRFKAQRERFIRTASTQPSEKEKDAQAPAPIDGNIDDVVEAEAQPAKAAPKKKKIKKRRR